VDNNCNMVADENCLGLGTFVSTATGDDKNPGTQQKPVQTLQQGMRNATTIGVGTEVYVAAGHYAEKITMVEDMNLLGGYDCDLTTCTWTRASAKNDTAILDVDGEGVLIPATLTRATKIDGFRIMGQDGSGQSRGRTAITVLGSAVISNNRIFGPNISSNGTGVANRSMGVLVLAPAADSKGALLDKNQITGGKSGDASMAVIAENPAAAATPALLHLSGNTIRGGAGGSMGAGVAAFSAGAGSDMIQNDVWAGSASLVSGGAWALVVSDHLFANANTFNAGNTTIACQAGTTRWCGGIESQSGTMTITNNLIFGVPAPLSAGVHLLESERATGVIVLNSNLLDGGGAASSASTTGTLSAALLLEIGSCTTCGFLGAVGHVRNNILQGGTASARFGVYELAPATKQQHPGALENNLFYVSGTLLPTDALYRYFDGSTQTLYTQASQVNALGTMIPAMPPVSKNLSGNPMLDSAYHLTNGSPCINAGTATEAPAADRDGDMRPAGSATDIGPDEF
jgi:hypothetical protein